MKKKLDNLPAIETVLAIPRNQFVYSYSLNEGVKHIIKKEEVVSYMKQFIEEDQISKLINFVHCFRPFLIVVSENRIIELIKDQNDFEYYSKQLQKELHSKIILRKDPVQDRIPNTTITEKNFNKFFKIFK